MTMLQLKCRLENCDARGGPLLPPPNPPPRYATSGTVCIICLPTFSVSGRKKYMGNFLITRRTKIAHFKYFYI